MSGSPAALDEDIRRAWTVGRRIGPDVTVCLTEPDTRLRPLIRYSIEEAFVRAGYSLRIVEGEPAPDMVVYGPAPAGWAGSALRYDRRCYDPLQPFAPIGSPPLWGPQWTEREDIDLIGGLGRLLTLADEAQVDERARDIQGIFSVTALPAARREVRAEPLAEYHAAALARQLKRLLPGLPDPAPRWPGGRSYAVVATHDADAVTLAAPSGAKALFRRQTDWARMARNRLTGKGDDPTFGFRSWADIERAAGLRSAFFVSGRGTMRRSRHDARPATFGDRTDWDLLRELADEGWEFGLHPSIRAKDDIDELLRGKELLESRLNRPIFGIRHRHWALDWRRPHLTFRKHVNAGFRYDASIAWRDDAGFRAGTSLLYRPYDPGRERPADLCELPTAMIAGHLIESDGDIELAVARALRIAENVRRVGGVLVIDWPATAAADDGRRRNLRTVFARLVTELQTDSTPWFATPWELIKHWHAYRKRLLVPESCQ